MGCEDTQMYDRARKLGISLFVGTSILLATLFIAACGGSGNRNFVVTNPQGTADAQPGNVQIILNLATARVLNRAVPLKVTCFVVEIYSGVDLPIDQNATPTFTRDFARAGTSQQILDLGRDTPTGQQLLRIRYLAKDIITGKLFPCGVFDKAVNIQLGSTVTLSDPDFENQLIILASLFVAPGRHITPPPNMVPLTTATLFFNPTDPSSIGGVADTPTVVDFATTATFDHRPYMTTATITLRDPLPEIESKPPNGVPTITTTATINIPPTSFRGFATTATLFLGGNPGNFGDFDSSGSIGLPEPTGSPQRFRNFATTATIFLDDPTPFSPGPFNGGFATTATLGLGGNLSFGNFGTGLKGGRLPDDFLPATTATIFMNIQSPDGTVTAPSTPTTVAVTPDGKFRNFTTTASIFLGDISFRSNTPPPPVTGPQIHVVNLNDGIDTISDAENANGTPTKTTIAGGLTGLALSLNPALDEGRDTLYVPNLNINTISAFSSISTAQGNIAPSRTITGITTPIALAFDSTNDRLYVSTNTPGAQVAIFDNVSAANGAVAPSRTITGFSLGATGIAIDVPNNRLFVSVDNGSIDVFDNASTTSGTRTANVDRTVTLPVLLVNPRGLFLDQARQRLYVADSGGGSRVVAFNNAGTMDGLTPPSGVLTGGGLDNPNGLALDLVRDELYVTNITSNTVTVFANASTADGVVTAVRTLGGFNQPQGIVFNRP